MIVAAGQNAYGELFVWSLILIGVVVAGFLVVAWVKRRMRPEDSGPTLGRSIKRLYRWCNQLSGTIWMSGRSARPTDWKS
jgi:hypothetical protein